MSEHIETLSRLMDVASCRRLNFEERQEFGAAIAALRTPQPVTPAGGEAPYAWATPGGDVSRSLLWCQERCFEGPQPRPLFLHPPVADAALAGDAELGRYIRLTAEQRNHGLSPPAFWLRVEQAIERRAALNQRGGGRGK